jgi:hypothetical protein
LRHTLAEGGLLIHHDPVQFCIDQKPVALYVSGKQFSSHAFNLLQSVNQQVFHSVLAALHPFSDVAQKRFVESLTTCRPDSSLLKIFLCHCQAGANLIGYRFNNFAAGNETDWCPRTIGSAQKDCVCVSIAKVVFQVDEIIDEPEGSGYVTRHTIGRCVPCRLYVWIADTNKLQEHTKWKNRFFLDGKKSSIRVLINGTNSCASDLRAIGAQE